jgi:hypothetical protein
MWSAVLNLVWIGAADIKPENAVLNRRGDGYVIPIPGADGEVDYVDVTWLVELAALGVPGTQEKCPPVPVHPPDADINANIDEAKKHSFASVWNPLKPLFDLKGAIWFRDQVKNKGPWDYKQRGSQYQDFGNFNYGAAGLAVGFDERTLLREAGRAQQAAGTSRPEWGDPGNRINPWGGTPPFGDDPVDRAQIKKGFEYYRAKMRGCQ